RVLSQDTAVSQPAGRPRSHCLVAEPSGVQRFHAGSSRRCRGTHDLYHPPTVRTTDVCKSPDYLVATLMAGGSTSLRPARASRSWPQDDAKGSKFRACRHWLDDGRSALDNARQCLGIRRILQVLAVKGEPKERCDELAIETNAVGRRSYH